jgi:hypothetical protein
MEVTLGRLTVAIYPGKLFWIGTTRVANTICGAIHLLGISLRFGLKDK